MTVPVTELLNRRPSFRVAEEAHQLSEEPKVVQAFLDGQHRGSALRETVSRAMAISEVDRTGAVARARERRSVAKRRRALRHPAAFTDRRDLARPLIEAAVRDHRATEMRDWQREADEVLATWDDGRTAAANRGEVRALVTGMRDNLVGLSMLEGHRMNWPAAREAAEHAIALQDRWRERIGLVPHPKAHLHAALARFRMEGLSTPLRDEVEAARHRFPGSPALAYWAGRYHLMAGDAGSAATAVSRHRRDPKVRRDLLPLLEPLQQAEPDRGMPENFYSYAQNFADDEHLHLLGDELDSYSTLAKTAPKDWPTDFRTLVDQSLDVAVGNVGAREVDTPDLLSEDAGRGLDASSDPYAIKAGARARRAANFARNRAAMSQAHALDYLRSNPDNLQRIAGAADLGNRAVGCLQAWNQAAQELRVGRSASAQQLLQQLQMKLTEYFSERYPGQCSPQSNPDGAWTELVRVGRYLMSQVTPVHSGVSRRTSATSLTELYSIDWSEPLVSSLGYEPYADANAMVGAFLKNERKIAEKVDRPLLVMGLVLAPLGIADCGRRNRDLLTAIRTYRQLLRLQQGAGYTPLCAVVEVPFIRIALSQVLHERGDGEFKAGQRDTATTTYQEVLTLWQGFGRYRDNVDSGVAALSSDAAALLEGQQHPLAVGVAPLSSEQRVSLAGLGRDVPVDSISVTDAGAAGADARLAPHQSLLSWTLTPGANEANPQIYGAICRAHARLNQLSAGLNYLGYPEGYAPVERASTLLDRARAFAEHAKNAKRDYLNFLDRAEDQLYREVGVQQSVALEKSAVAVEDARLQQARLSATSAEAGAQLALVTASDARRRLDNYQTFDAQMSDAENLQLVGAALSGIGGMVSGAAGGGVAGAAGGALSAAGGMVSTMAQQQMAHAQRELEQQNLALAIDESVGALGVARSQADVARQGVTVASLDHATALLRHDYAVQNLDYLRNGRLLNSDMWFRLAESMRDLSRRALDRAIEVAFLAQQAYAAEADKDVNIIRFDYDDSPVGAFLAGDFLLQDLDALEQDQVGAMLQEQQPVRLVISLARDCPSSLAALQTDGSAVVPLTLRSLESRLPGLHDLRIATMSVQPVALMDPARQSVAISHLGVGQVRRRLGAARDADNVIGGWLPEVGDQWPVVVHVATPVTHVFTGLSDSEAAAVVASQRLQRNPFEGLSPAASWHLDLAPDRNGLVPGSLADVLLTFTLVGVHDSRLAQAVSTGAALPSARTQYLSTVDMFPDQFYAFQQSGVLEWVVPRELVQTGPEAARLRNVGVCAVPAPPTVSFSDMSSTIAARFRAHTDGTVEWVDVVPQVVVTLDTLKVTVATAGTTGVTTWDPGDGSAVVTGSSMTHTYARAGDYTITLRVTDAGGAAFRWLLDVVADPLGAAVPPLTVFPQIKGALDAATGSVTVSAKLGGPESDSVALWRVDGGQTVTGATAELRVTPGLHRLEVRALRTLTATFSCSQRAGLAAALPMKGLALTTNRIFDAVGVEQNKGRRNPLARQLFQAGEIDPSDTWRLVVDPALNPSLVTVDQDGHRGVDLGSVRDLMLVLEYDEGADSSAGTAARTYGWEFIESELFSDAALSTSIDARAVTPGLPLWVRMTVANLGTATWTPSQVSVTSAEDASLAGVMLEASVESQRLATFVLAMSAPVATGNQVRTFVVRSPTPRLGEGNLTLELHLETGLTGTYFQGRDLSDPVYTRVDPTVDFDWNSEGPDEMGREEISVRWTGRLHVTQAGTYEFVTNSDDGCRLWIDDSLVIDDWTEHAPTRRPSAPMTLAAGSSHRVRLEYFQGVGGAEVHLSWVRPDGVEEIIPERHLDPLSGV
jgi:hypothetical protein